jgi:hypothetical protein
VRQIELVKIEFVSMKNHDALTVSAMEKKVQAMEGKMTGWSQVRCACMYVALDQKVLGVQHDVGVSLSHSLSLSLSLSRSQMMQSFLTG